MAKLKWKGEEAMRIIRRAAENGTRDAAIIVQAKWKDLIGKAGKGRVYIKKSGRVHIASAPGDPPAKDTGDLGRSIQVDLSGVGERNPRARIGSNQEKARYMELGTRHIAPRPSALPALRQSKKRVLQAMDARVKKATKELDRLP